MMLHLSKFAAVAALLVSGLAFGVTPAAADGCDYNDCAPAPPVAVAPAPPPVAVVPAPVYVYPQPYTYVPAYAYAPVYAYPRPYAYGYRRYGYAGIRPYGYVNRFYYPRHVGVRGRAWRR